MVERREGSRGKKNDENARRTDAKSASFCSFRDPAKTTPHHLLLHTSVLFTSTMMTWYESVLLWREQRRGFELGFILGIVLALWGIALIALYDKLRRGCILSALGAVLWFTVDRTSQPPRNGISTSHPLLVCLGDSLTHGQCSANVVDRIVPLLKSKCRETDIHIMNAGQNNICSWTVYHKRLEGILRYNPDYVLVWIGTNDVRAIYKKWWFKQLECMWNLPERPSIRQLQVNVDGIVTRLLSHSPCVQVGLCTLPPMGEGLTDPANECVRQANAILEKIARRAGERCTIVPVYDALERAIVVRQSTLGWKPPVDYFLGFSLIMGILHHVFGYSWNQVSRLVGNTVLSDSLHLNETGADIVANTVVEWLVDKRIAQDDNAAMPKKTR